MNHEPGKECRAIRQVRGLSEPSPLFTGSTADTAFITKTFGVVRRGNSDISYHHEHRQATVPIVDIIETWVGALDRLIFCVSGVSTCTCYALTGCRSLCLYAFDLLEHVTASATGGPSGPLFRDFLFAGQRPLKHPFARWSAARQL